jgi:uncharacterized cupredoxin-like copper-binding protein
VRRAQASIGLLLVLGAGLLAGCGETSSQATGIPRVSVSERDFHIDAPRYLHSGLVDLAVHNMGPDDHELIVVRGTRSSLPFRTDGLTIDEDAVSKREAGALEPGRPGADRNLDVDLAPGRYVMFCNMYGHFEAGMHHELVVR